MNIEQKAKRYDEALKVLHKYDGANIMFSQSLKEEMFPEIKESEDDRIRKIIKQSLKSYFEGKLSIGTNDVDYAACLSWLEKQCEQSDKVVIKKGEQKPTNSVIEEEKPLLEKFRQAVYDCAWEKVTCKKEGETKEEYANRWAEQFILIVRDWADDYIDFTIQQKLRNSYEKGKSGVAGEQCEQKPYEEYNITGIRSKNAQGKLGEMIMNLKPVNEVLEQKPAWSEEDKEMLDQVIEDIVKLAGPYVCYNKDVEWLKYLKERAQTKK